MDIFHKLKEEFTSEDEKNFLTHFQCYLEYDQTKDFVIDLYDVIDYLGYSRKDVIKRILIRTFQNSDYIVTNGNENAIGKHGGQNKERILMTPNTFKELCIKADTEKAHQIRKYYIKMENILFKHMTERIKTLSAESHSFKERCALLERELDKHKTREKKKYEIGDTVYIVKENDVFKVGSTSNMMSRDKTYDCHSNIARVVYTKRCRNMKMLEDIVHHQLAKYQIYNRKDWFKVDFQTIRDTIDQSHFFLDHEEGSFTLDENASNEEENTGDFPNEDQSSDCSSSESEDEDEDEEECEESQNIVMLDKKPRPKTTYGFGEKLLKLELKFRNEAENLIYGWEDKTAKEQSEWIQNKVEDYIKKVLTKIDWADSIYKKHKGITEVEKLEKGWYFITIRPHPDLKFHKFKEFIEKLFKRKAFSEGFYVWEQKGTSKETMGEGFHIHAVVKQNSPSKGMGYVKEIIYSTMKKCEVDDSIGAGNYPIRALKTQKELDSVHHYTETEFFNKNTPEKEEAWNYDKPWRASVGLSSLYQVGERTSKYENIEKITRQCP